METQPNIIGKEPLPLESLPPLPVRNTAREVEKGQYWNTLLSGSLEQVPLELRRKVGADNEQEPAEVRDYRLASCINRSWVVDHRNMPREQVRANWPELRRHLAAEHGVQDDEQELYAALSLQQKDSPAREQVRRVYAETYTASLRGEDTTPPESEAERFIHDAARESAARVRREYLPLAEALSQGWAYLKAEESSAFPLPDMLAGAPGLIRAVDALADMAPAERAKVYGIARSLEASRQLEEPSPSLGKAMLHSVRRGSADIRHALVQGVGHAAAALTHAAGETLESDTLRQGAAALDKRLQALHELRRVAQGEVFPIELGEDSALWEELAVASAGAVPGAALSFMGGAGFGLLALSGAGEAVAEARRRNPEGRQELQTAAGIVGGALQAGIYMGMSRIGAQMLSRCISNFSRAAQSGIKGYSMAALRSLGVLTAENAKLLLAGKSAQAAELGMQELAARVDRVASHIDWEAFGHNILDIETNMREAAMNLPYILIAAGRAALHHFRSPDAILENRRLLENWGVDEPTRQRIIEAPDMNTRTTMLREALSGNRRWGGAGSLRQCLRALSLLNNELGAPFRDERAVRGFLRLPAGAEPGRGQELVPRDMSKPKIVKQVADQLNEGHRASLLSRKGSLEYLQYLDEIYQRGQGELLRNPEKKLERISHYLSTHVRPESVVPEALRLGAHYNPYLAREVNSLIDGYLNEFINLSYQYLSNTESLGGLMNSYRTLDQARKSLELKRRVFVSRLCEAVANAMHPDARESSLRTFGSWLSGRYDTRRRSSSHAPLWLRRVERSELLEMYDRAPVQAAVFNKKKPGELRDACRIMLGARACAEALLELLPHSGEFQGALSRGCSPEQAGAQVLRQKLLEHLDPDTWMPEPLPAADAQTLQSASAQNQALCRRYQQLSGYDMESSPDGSGRTLWRYRHPDGEYSPWFPSYGAAVNSLVGNAQIGFLQIGRGILSPDIEQAYRQLLNGRRIFGVGSLQLQPAEPLSAFEHKGSEAVEALRSLWLGDSTFYSMGLEYEANRAKWNRAPGRLRMPLVKDAGAGRDMFLAYPRREETPQSLAERRFFVYWNRLLSSGWVSPEAVGEALVQAGELDRKRLEFILKKGRDKPLYLWNNRDRAERRNLLRKYPDRIVPGDTAAMNADLARRMADYNVLYMLADMPDAKLPESVREWFYTSALGDAADAGRLARVMDIRDRMKSGQGVLLADRLRHAYQPDASHRYEQGWCYAVGGASAFRSSGQSFWNLLEDPARGWKLLTPEERDALAEELRDYCGGQPPEQRLQELSEVLREYPGLRAYASDMRNGGRLQRMELSPLEDSSRPRHLAEKYARPVVQRGFTLEDVETLPAEWSADARVLPALQLLTELRRQVTASPYADDRGIWWQQERYGGPDGRKPNGLDERWRPAPALRPLVRFYRRVEELGRTYGAHGQLNVCGVALGGIAAGELDLTPLKNVTVYTTPRQPEHMVRLMPGEPNASNPCQRKPYVVHTADGVPLLPKRLARLEAERMDALMPLNTFRSDMERMYDYHTNQRWRREQIAAHLEDLLMRRAVTPETWALTDSGDINNLELFMQVFQDGRFSEYMEKKDPTQLNRGEALAAELARLLLLAEYGTNREPSVEKLVQFCHKLRESREDKELLQTALHRIVSPEPNRYWKVELPRPEEDRELDLSPEDAEYY